MLHSERSRELLQFERPKLTVAWAAHTVHGQSIMELLDPVAEYFFHRVCLQVLVTIECHLAHDLTFIFQTILLLPEVSQIGDPNV